MSAKLDMGLKVFCCLFDSLGFLNVFLKTIFALSSLVVLVSLVFPAGLVFSNFCIMFKRVPGNN